MPRLDENLATLREMLTAPCLGVLRHQTGACAVPDGCELAVDRILAAARLIDR
jgi:hypothetical protein